MTRIEEEAPTIATDRMADDKVRWLQDRSAHLGHSWERKVVWRREMAVCRRCGLHCYLADKAPAGPFDSDFSRITSCDEFLTKKIHEA